jgi:hypothetical protein
LNRFRFVGPCVLSSIRCTMGISELKEPLYVKASYGIMYMTCTVRSVGLHLSACDTPTDVDVASLKEFWKSFHSDATPREGDSCF